MARNVTTPLMHGDDCWETLSDVAYLLDEPCDLHQLRDRLRSVLPAFPPKCADRRAYLVGKLLANTVEVLDAEIKNH